MSLSIRTPAPLFTLPATDECFISLADYRGRLIVVYFYPKDNTPGCTREAEAFRDVWPRFEASNVAVIGLSRDSVKSHDGFKSRYTLPFPLASDADGTVCRAYGVWKERILYGRPSFGVERSTFLIDPAGIVCALWRKVKISDHAEAVLKAIDGLSARGGEG